MLIRTQDRLEQFSNTFNAAAACNCFSNLDSEGLESTKGAMMTALDNWCQRVDLVKNFSDPFALMSENVYGHLAKQGRAQDFSNDLGGIASTNISTLILGSYYQSYAMSYIAKLEGMTDQKTIYNIQQLKAANDFGIYHKDDIVLDPRTSMNPMGQVMGSQINTKSKEITGATVTDQDFGVPIRIGTVDMFIQETGKDTWVKVGFDRPDGYSKGKLFSKVNAGDISIDYRTGKITVAEAQALTNVAKIKFEAAYDSTWDKTQSQVPTLYSGNDSIELNAMGHQFKLEQNLEDIVHMNKVYAYNKPAGVASSYAQNTVAQLMSFYVRSLDTNIMRTLVMPYIPYLRTVKENEAFNLAGWTAAGNMNLFEGRMFELFAHLDQTMANETDGRRPTCIVVDTVGAVNLMTNRFFKRQGAGVFSSDGYVGTLYGLPVIKSRVLDTVSSDKYKGYELNISDDLKKNLSIDTAAGEAASIGFVCHKNPGNKEASIIVGDYIVPWCTSSMPSVGGTVVEHSILCEYAVKLMLPRLAIPIVCKVSAHPNFRVPEITVY